MKRKLFLLSNGPGELLTWVKPILPYLKDYYDIYLFILPCQFSSGREYDITSTWGEVSCVFSPKETLSFLLFPGRKMEASAVLQMGGDTFYGRWFKWKFRVPYILYTMAVRRFKDVDYIVMPYRLLAEKMLDMGFPEDRIYVFGNLMLSGLRKVERKEAKKVMGWNGKMVVGFLPGSRVNLFPYNFDFAKKVAVIVKEKFGVDVAFLVSDFLRDDELASWQADGIHLVKENNRIEFFNACDVVIAPPGSNNFEIAYLTGKGIVVLPFELLDKVPVQGIWHFLLMLPLIGVRVRKRMFERFMAEKRYLSWVNRILGFPFLKEIVGYNIEDEIVQSIGELLVDKEVDIGSADMLFDAFDVNGFTDFLKRVAL